MELFNESKCAALTFLVRDKCHKDYARKLLASGKLLLAQGAEITVDPSEADLDGISDLDEVRNRLFFFFVAHFSYYIGKREDHA